MYSPFRYISSIAWKGRPIHLTFFITRRCNSKCPYCFYLRSDDAPPVSAPELSLEEIERISSSLGSLLWLAFSGGEIFLRDDLVEIARTFYRNNKPAIIRGSVIALNSANGQQLWATKLKGAEFVNVVLDGNNLYAATHGEIYCLEPRTGIIRWHNPLKGYGFGLVSIAGEGIAQSVSALTAEKRRRDDEEASSGAAATAAS